MFIDAVREDMAEVEVMEEDVEDRTKWRREIRCSDLLLIENNFKI